MSNKHLDENEIVNELKGSSLFFPHESESPPPPQSEPQPIHEMNLRKVNTPHAQFATNSVPRSRPKPNPVKSSTQGNGTNAKVTNDASVPASMLARHSDSVIEEIRKTVKATGKEVSFVRLTPEEKNLLVDIVYTYKRQGVKTSENEINRIAVNFLLLDFKVNGAESILTRVIEALLA